jgi:hypothetical protein
LLPFLKAKRHVSAARTGIGGECEKVKRSEDGHDCRHGCQHVNRRDMHVRFHYLFSLSNEVDGFRLSVGGNRDP